ncbi:MAG: hypothetical protein IJ201_07655 [Solobacterium sp.]|nr:hypothetical protein [Solobacterium sp.]
MRFSLYPYNMYILYAALALTLIVLVITAAHALKTLKVLKSLPLDKIKASLETVKKKTAESGAVVKKTADGLKTVVLTSIILKALDRYSDKEERNPVKRVSKAATSLAKDTRSNLQLINAIRKGV